MNLHSQLAIGNFINSLSFNLFEIVLVTFIPLLIWFVIALIFWFRSNRKVLKWWGVAASIGLIIGMITFGLGKVFNGAPYMIAQRINVYIPMSVRVLENDQTRYMDGVTEYEVIQFNNFQMEAFIKSIQTKGWKHGAVVPNTLRHGNPDDGSDAMAGRKYPLPKEKRTGYFYTYIKKENGTGDWHTIRNAYFLDVKTGILYIYFDDSQWGKL